MKKKRGTHDRIRLRSDKGGKKKYGEKTESPKREGDYQRSEIPRTTPMDLAGRAGRETEGLAASSRALMPDATVDNRHSVRWMPD